MSLYRLYHYREPEPLSEMLDAVINGFFYDVEGQGHGRRPAAASRCQWWEGAQPYMNAVMHHPAVWSLLGGEFDPAHPFGGRHPFSMFRLKRPEVWEETVNAEGLDPDSIKLRAGEGNTIVMKGKPSVGGEEVTKNVELPEQVIKTTIRCYVSEGAVHLFGLKKPAAENQAIAAGEGGDASQNRMEVEPLTALVEKPTTSMAVMLSEQFRRKYDIRGFKPSEVKVKLQGRKLTVSAEHKEEREGYMDYRQFHESMTLGDDVNLAEMKSQIDDKGMLVITAPTAAERDTERLLPIEH